MKNNKAAIGGRTGWSSLRAYSSKNIDHKGGAHNLCIDIKISERGRMVFNRFITDLSNRNKRAPFIPYAHFRGKLMRQERRG